MHMQCTHEGLYGFLSNFQSRVIALVVPKVWVSKTTDTDWKTRLELMLGTEFSLP
jgi:hypothetical protein